MIRKGIPPRFGNSPDSPAAKHMRRTAARERRERELLAHKRRQVIAARGEATAAERRDERQLRKAQRAHAEAQGGKTPLLDQICQIPTKRVT